MSVTPPEIDHLFHCPNCEDPLTEVEYAIAEHLGRRAVEIASPCCSEPIVHRDWDDLEALLKAQWPNGAIPWPND